MYEVDPSHWQEGEPRRYARRNVVYGQVHGEQSDVSEQMKDTELISVSTCVYLGFAHRVHTIHGQLLRFQHIVYSTRGGQQAPISYTA